MQVVGCCPNSVSVASPEFCTSHRCLLEDSLKEHQSAAQLSSHQIQQISEAINEANGRAPPAATELMLMPSEALKRLRNGSNN